MGKGPVDSARYTAIEGQIKLFHIAHQKVPLKITSTLVDANHSFNTL